MIWTASTTELDVRTPKTLIFLKHIHKLDSSIIYSYFLYQSGHSVQIDL